MKIPSQSEITYDPNFDSFKAAVRSWVLKNPCKKTCPDQKSIRYRLWLVHVIKNSKAYQNIGDQFLPRSYLKKKPVFKKAPFEDFKRNFQTMVLLISCVSFYSPNFMIYLKCSPHSSVKSDSKLIYIKFWDLEECLQKIDD